MQTNNPLPHLPIWECISKQIHLARKVSDKAFDSKVLKMLNTKQNNPWVNLNLDDKTVSTENDCVKEEDSKVNTESAELHTKIILVWAMQVYNVFNDP